MKRRFSIVLYTVCSINEELIEKGLIVDGVPGDELEGYDFSPHFSKIPLNFYYFDLLSRALQPKPLKSELLLTVKSLYSFGERLFLEDVMFLCLKFLFEINLLGDPIAATVTLSTIKTLDADFKPDESLMVSRGIQQLEALRRQQSTGHNVDTSSFLHFQRQQRHLADLHRDCLDGLYAFWTVLSKPKVDLSVLPSILEKVQKSKKTIVLNLSKLLHQHGDQQSLLVSYASFVREVECDEERAAVLEEQAQLLCSSDKSSSQGASSYSGSITFPNPERKKKENV
ncbi:hypothetical protein GEMRC1_012644 [Eukaryota sp. GEM-RC1]